MYDVWLSAGLWTELWDLVGRMPWRLRYSLYT